MNLQMLVMLQDYDDSQGSPVKLYPLAKVGSFEKFT